MSLNQRPSALEFTLMKLREEIRTGQWLGRVPGEREVAARLKVSNVTVAAAFARLVEEGCLVKQGPRRRLRLGADWLERKPTKLRTLHILLNCPLELEGVAMRALLLRLKEEIAESGLICEMARKTQYMLGYDAERILRHMEEDPADAWIVVGGRRDLLEQVAARGMRVFALSGAFSGLPLAAGGHDANGTMTELVGRLTGLGHRRIVFIASATLVRPSPVRSAAAFVEALAKADITAGAYHLPDWDGNIEEFTPLLQELFRVTPPTALILSDTYQVCATYAFFCERGLRVPRDVSLAVMESDPALLGLRPELARIAKDWDGLRRIVMRWVTKGTPAGGGEPAGAKTWLLPGGTLGPAPAERHV